MMLLWRMPLVMYGGPLSYKQPCPNFARFEINLKKKFCRALFLDKTKAIVGHL